MPQNHVLLENIELSQAASSVTLDNIPQTGYSDLKIVVSARTSDANSISGMGFRVGNGTVDTGSNYTYREITGDGSTPSFSSGTVSSLNSITNGGSSTSNTFGNFEIYIPAYTSSTAKSMSVDAVTENNATSAQARLQAWYWGGTSAINIITFTATSTNFVAGSTFRIYGVAALNTTPVTSPLATGGQIVANDGTYWYHAFLSSGTFVPQKNLSCDYLVVAGGGAGGFKIGGGGGAGGFRASVGNTLVANTYPVIVGAGGSAPTSYVGQGSNSSINSFVSTGGGYGATGDNLNSAGAGGSGGGGSHQVGGQTGGAGNTPSVTPSQGNNGGVGYSGGGPNAFPGGGGGAGAVGGNGGGSQSGAGGSGSSTYNSINISSWLSTTNTGISGALAGGGGGGCNNSNGSPNSGSTGGGNGGGASAATSATANSGSGGGGGRNDNNPAGQGGSGIVIVRYPMAS
jgi:hypothetical protein